MWSEKSLSEDVRPAKHSKYCAKEKRKLNERYSFDISQISLKKKFI
jgi:hypothetical protein